MHSNSRMLEGKGLPEVRLTDKELMINSDLVLPDNLKRRKRHGANTTGWCDRVLGAIHPGSTAAKRLPREGPCS